MKPLMIAHTVGLALSGAFVLGGLLDLLGSNVVRMISDEAMLGVVVGCLVAAVLSVADLTIPGNFRKTLTLPDRSPRGSIPSRRRRTTTQLTPGQNT